MITKSYVKFLTDNGISANQFLLMWCLTQKENKIIKAYREKVGIDLSDIDGLIDKGFLLHTGGNDYSVESLVPTLEFEELVIANPVECAKQLRAVWYTSIIVNGRRSPARNISEDDLVQLYSLKILKGNKLEHFRIMNITKNYVASNSECSMGLKKYVETEYWNDLDDIEEDGFIKEG